MTQFIGEVPDYLKEFYQNEQIDTSKFTAGIGGSRGPHLSTKGSAFNLVDIDGTARPAVAPNGQLLFDPQRGPFIDVIVLDSSELVVKQYYERGFVEGEALPPDCWSNDGYYPDRSISEPQHDMCSGCPQNVFGTAKGESREGKACADRKRLAIMYLWDKGQGPVYEYSVSPSNLKGWSAYAYGVAGRVPGGVTAVVTRIFIDRTRQGGLLYEVAPTPGPSAQYPGGVGWWFLPQAMLPILKLARESTECKRAIGAEATPPRLIGQTAQPQQITQQQPQQITQQAPVEQQQQPVQQAPTPPAPRKRRTRAEIEAEEQLLAEARARASGQQQPQQQQPQQQQPQQQANMDAFAPTGGQQHAPLDRSVGDNGIPGFLDRTKEQANGATVNFGVATNVPASDPAMDDALAGMT